MTATPDSEFSGSIPNSIHLEDGNDLPCPGDTPVVNDSATVLIVDDQDVSRSLVAHFFQKNGDVVFQAEGITEAKKILQQESISLVIADVNFDEESGLQLLSDLAPSSPDIAVIIMTGNDDPQTAIGALRGGAFDYLLKPFDRQDLTDVASRVKGRQSAMKAERRRIGEQMRILGKFSSENPNPVMRASVSGKLLYANQSSGQLLEELGVDVGDQLPDRFCQLILSGLNRNEVSTGEFTSGEKDYSLTVTPIQGDKYVYLYGHDITALKAAEHELIRLKDRAQELASHDNLTGLPNRKLLEERFAETLETCRQTGENLAVIFVDLDNFKQINDTQGHEVGDQVLVSVANNLRESVRESDTVARWGGDEMILLLPGIWKQDLRKRCEGIKNFVQTQMFETDGFLVTISMGVALYPDDSQDPEILLQSADAAMMMVKRRARNGIILFGECEELKSFREQARIRAMLTKAVTTRQIQAFYQPIVEARSGRVVGVEALARWFHKEHGWISPELFIPLCEDMGLIRELGNVVKEKALRQLAELHKNGFPVGLSLNISLRQLVHSDFLEDLKKFVEDSDIPPQKLTLEITESQALLGLTTENEHLDELSRVGFRLSIDDFGKGHSSLASLHEIPADELKIDSKFVRNLDTPRGIRIVQTIEELSRGLQLETVAEGVETEKQMHLLQQLGVGKLQGYCFSPPLPRKELLEYLEENGVAQSLLDRRTSDDGLFLPA